MIKADFHSHTSYCDGTLAPRALVEAALERGLPALGFSGHSYTAFDTSYCMSQTATAQYQAEIAALKQEYAGRLELYCGIEQDAYSKTPTAAYDFVIGSLHYLRKDGLYLPVDESAASFRRIAQEFYGGDFYALCADYYRQITAMPARTNCHIIGHFDLVSKFNQDNALFDEADPRYSGPALAALATVCAQQPLFELNTGAIYRLAKKQPYPAPFLLRQLQKLGGQIILASDSHDAASLCHAFPQMLELLSELGFREVQILTEQGFKSITIK